MSSIFIVLILAVAIAVTAIVVVKILSDRQVKLQELDNGKAVKGIVLPLRLQAYERMALFLERIEPNQLVMRIHSNGLTVAQEQNLLLTAIRSEYEHNLSQQIYISTPVWNQVSGAKDDIIDIINAVAATFQSTDDSLTFAEALLAAPAEKPVVYQAMTILKADVQRLF